MKQTVKKILFAIVLIFLVNSHSMAQGMPVYDNTNFISFIKTLLESGKQTSQLMKTVKFLKQQKENIDKVNNVIKQLNAVKELAKNNHHLYEMVHNDLREILNSKYIKSDEVNRISDSFNGIIKSSTEALNYIDQILSSGSMKMTDGERAAILKAKEQESKEMVAEIEAKTRRYKEIIAFREMQDKINNRATRY